MTAWSFWGMTLRIKIRLLSCHSQETSRTLEVMCASVCICIAMWMLPGLGARGLARSRWRGLGTQLSGHARDTGRGRLTPSRVRECGGCHRTANVGV